MSDASFSVEEIASCLEQEQYRLSSLVSFTFLQKVSKSYCVYAFILFLSDVCLFLGNLEATQGQRVRKASITDAYPLTLPFVVDNQKLENP